MHVFVSNFTSKQREVYDIVYNRFDVKDYRVFYTQMLNPYDSFTEISIDKIIPQCDGLVLETIRVVIGFDNRFKLVITDLGVSLVLFYKYFEEDEFLSRRSIFFEYLDFDGVMEWFMAVLEGRITADVSRNIIGVKKYHNLSILPSYLNNYTSGILKCN